MKYETKNKIALFGVYLTGLCAAVVFLLVRVRGATEWVIHTDDYYSGRDLYKNHYIEHFRESHPAFDQSFTSRVPAYRESPDHPALDEADLLIFGDSFMNFRWLPSFPERLGEQLDRKVHFAMDHYPHRYLQEQEAEKCTDEKLLLFAIGERGIREGFYVRGIHATEGSQRRRDHKTPFFRMLTEGRAEERYSGLLQLSVLTHRLYKWIATRKFDWFGYISPTTPVYSLDPPILFYYSTVDESASSIQYQHPTREIETIVRRIANLHDSLLEVYGLRLVFMGIPNKISIHHDLVWDDAQYNDFLPRIQQGLEEQGIPFVDLYGPFSKSEEQLYFLSDTHWNENGIDLALQEALTFLEENPDFP